MPQLTVRISDDLESLIEKKQQQLPYDVPKSEIARTALEEHLSGNVRVGTVV